MTGGGLLARLFPAQADNRFEGLRPALWLLGVVIALKMIMGVRSILDTRAVAEGADGIPLDSFGPEAAREVLLLFALMAVGHLFLELVALMALLRYRALVPLAYLMLLSEHVVRRLVAQSYAMPGAGSTAVAQYVNYGLLTLLAAGFALSLVQRSRGRSDFIKGS